MRFLRKIILSVIRGVIYILDKTFILYLFVLVWVLAKNILFFLHNVFFMFVPYLFNIFLVKLKNLLLRIVHIRIIQITIGYFANRYTAFQHWLSGEQKYNTSQTEFLPIALEVLETPPSRTIRLFWLLLVVLFTFTFIYISIAKTEIIISSTGKVASRSRVISVTSVMSGKVSDIYVSEGDYVSLGAPLLSTRNELLHTQARVKKLKESGDIAQTGALSYLYQKDKPNLKKLTYDKSIINFANKLQESYITDIDKMNQQIKLARVTRTNLQFKVNLCQSKTLPTYEKILRSSLRKYKDGIIGKEQYNNTLVSYNRIKIECKDFSYKLSSSSIRLQILLDGIAERKQKFLISKQVAYYKYANIKKAYLDIIRTNTKYVYYSEIPEAIVGNINVGKNGAVREGQKLVELVPTTDKIVEGYVLNRYSGSVRKGQRVYFKVNAFPYTKFGLAKGVIYYISPNSEDRKGLGFVNKIKVRLTDVPPNIKLQVGMDGQIEIRMGERTLLEYFLTPLKRTVNESMREL